MSARFPTEGATPVRHLLVVLVSAVCRFPRLVLAVSLGLAALSVHAACFHLNYRTQRSDLISPDKDYQKRWHAYVAEFGEDDDIVVVVEGNSPERMKQALDRLDHRLRDRPDLFDRVFHRVDLRPLHRRSLLFLPTKEIEEIHRKIERMDQEGLLRYAPLSWHGLSLSSLLEQARVVLGKLDSSTELTSADQEFLDRLQAVCNSAAATLRDPDAYENPWGKGVIPVGPGEQGSDQENVLTEPQYFFGDDGRLAFLLARPIKDTSSFTAARENVEVCRAIVQEVRAEFPDLAFGITGMPVLENDEMVAAERDTRLAFWLAVAGVSLLYFCVYRKLPYPLLTMGTLLVGTAWAMGWATWTVGHLNILSATFAVMLIGTGDYGVLWVMRYEQARQQGMEVRAALLHTTRYVAMGNLTAASTLALAFFAAMLADFQAVGELGWIAGSGILLCALACFTVLPATLTLCDRRANLGLAPGQLRVISEEGEKVQPAAIRKVGSLADTWLPGLARRPRLTLGIGAVVALLLVAGISRLSYDHNLLHLQPKGLDTVQWELKLLERTSGSSWHALSYRATPEQVQQLKAKYQAHPSVSRVVEVASLLPADQEQKLPHLRAIQETLHRGLPPRGQRIAHPRPNLASLQTTLRDVLALVPPLPALSRLRTNLQTLNQEIENQGPRAANLLQHFDERIAGDLAEDLHHLREVSHAEPITLADLPQPLRERHVSKNGQWLLRIFAKDSLWEYPTLERFTEEMRTVDPEVTGRPFGTLEGLRAMKNGLTRAGIYAFLVIVVVLLLDFRSIPRALIAVLPLVLGVALTLGILGYLGMPLNPANMIAFPLILGVGVDNGVHVLHDYLIRRQQGQATISYALGRGVLVKSLTALIGFGVLMLSSQQGLASLGFILALGVGTSLLAALVLLPAALSLWGGKKVPGTCSPFLHQAPRQAA
jgi:hopanoid biosynthesis associated RND transporter like protein HpnN